MTLMEFHVKARQLSPRVDHVLLRVLTDFDKERDGQGEPPTVRLSTTCFLRKDSGHLMAVEVGWSGLNGFKATSVAMLYEELARRVKKALDGESSVGDDPLKLGDPLLGLVGDGGGNVDGD